MKNLEKYISEFTLIQPDSYLSIGVYLRKRTSEEGEDYWVVDQGGNSSSRLNLEGLVFYMRPSSYSKIQEFHKDTSFKTPTEAILAFKNFLINGKYQRVVLLEWQKRFPKDL